MLNVDLSPLSSFLSKEQLSAMEPRVRAAHQLLESGTGAGNDYIGWLRLPKDYDKEEFARIQQAAKKIQSDSQVLVVIGIGGSYLGARAVVELLRSPNYNLKKKDTPDILFTGNTLSTDAIRETIELIGDRDFSINIISKSGTTTEPAVAFRIFKKLMEDKYGKEEARRRIYATISDTARWHTRNPAVPRKYGDGLRGNVEQQYGEGCRPFYRDKRMERKFLLRWA